MRVTMNGYFWDQPRTGSGQYLQHLWAELVKTAGPAVVAGPELGGFVMLLPRGMEEDVPVGPGFSAVCASQHGAIAGRSRYLDKVLWEQRGSVQEAKRQSAGLLHVPYLSAPLRPGSLPVVVTAHDMVPWVVPGYRGSLAFRLYLAFTVSGVKRAALILADSDASQRDVIKVLGVSPRRVRTIYLGMEEHPAYTPEQLAEVRARFSLPEHFAFYLGGFDRRKNVPLLLRAWRTAIDSLGPDYPVLAIGGAVPEPGGVFSDVISEARALGFGGDGGPVRFLGRISEEDKPLLMAAARIFVYPSAYEGFGLDPLEAMSAGGVVVSSCGGSLAEVVGNGALLVPPNDERALSGGIVRAWSDDGLRAGLSKRGREQAAHFTWGRTARETLDAYRHAYRSGMARTRRG